MVHLFQVGAGSGGMPVLDMLSRDQRIERITLVEPDVYKAHNVERHLFPPSAVGQGKADLARQWLLERRPELRVDVLVCDLLAGEQQPVIEQIVAEADLGVCAADNEPAKFHFDGLMRQHRKPWTLGEVLSGGIGGFVHGFVPDGPCYGCVASHLHRSVNVDNTPAPDYSAPGGPVAETTIPASIAAIHAIAALHAQLTLALLDHMSDQAEGNGRGDLRAFDPGFTTLLWTMRRVPGVFEEAYRPYRFRVTRSPACLICQERASNVPSSKEELDVALDQALARLGNE